MSFAEFNDLAKLNDAYIAINDGSVSYRQDANEVIYTNATLSLGKNTTIYADRIIWQQDNNTITFQNNVIASSPPWLIKAEQITYNLRDKKIIGRDAKISQLPFIIKVEKFYQVDNNDIIGENVMISSHDVKQSNFHFSASKVKLVPNKYFFVYNSRIHIKNKTIFWLPYFPRSLNKETGYHFNFQQRSNLGLQWLNLYGVDLYPRKKNTFIGQVQADLYTRRGVAFGLNLLDLRQPGNQQKGLNLYYIKDRNPQILRTNIARTNLSNDRYYGSLQYTNYLNSRQTSRIAFNLNIISDPYMIEDFYSKQYRINPFPNNQIQFIHQFNQNFVGYIDTQLALNDFYQTQENLPQLILSSLPIYWKKSGIQQYTQLQLGLYRERFVEDTDLTRALRLQTDQSLLQTIGSSKYYRYYALQEWSRPFYFLQGSARIHPYTAAGFQGYWLDQTTNSFFQRYYLNVGVDASLTLSRYTQLTFPFLKSLKLLQVVQPYLNYSHLNAHGSTPANFFPIQRYTPTIQLQPLRLSNMAFVDDIQDQSALRIGVRNNYYLNSSNSYRRWLEFNIYAQYYFDNRNGQNFWSNLFQEIYWQPLPWIQLFIRQQTPLSNHFSSFNESHIDLSFAINKKTTLGTQYQYLRSHPLLADSENIRGYIYYHLNESTTFGANFSFDLQDSILERQEYFFGYDIGGWYTSLGVFINDNRNRREHGFFLRFFLKGTQQYQVPLRWSNDSSSR